ncbi:hypothetical protein, partial [Belnapia rosea]
MGIDQWQRASIWRRGAARADASFLEPGEASRPSRPPPPPLSKSELEESAARWAKARLKERVRGPVTLSEATALGLSAAALTALLDHLGPRGTVPADQDLAGLPPDPSHGLDPDAPMAAPVSGLGLASALPGGADAPVASGGSAATGRRSAGAGPTVIPSGIVRGSGEVEGPLPGREAGFTLAATRLLDGAPLGKAALLAEAAFGLNLAQAAGPQVIGGAEAAALAVARGMADSGAVKAKAAEVPVPPAKAFALAAEAPQVEAVRPAGPAEAASTASAVAAPRFAEAPMMPAVQMAPVFTAAPVRADAAMPGPVADGLAGGVKPVEAKAPATAWSKPMPVAETRPAEAKPASPPLDTAADHGARPGLGGHASDRGLVVHDKAAPLVTETLPGHEPDHASGGGLPDPVVVGGGHVVVGGLAGVPVLVPGMTVGHGQATVGGAGLEGVVAVPAPGPTTGAEDHAAAGGAGGDGVAPV